MSFSRVGPNQTIERGQFRVAKSGPFLVLAKHTALRSLSPFRAIVPLATSASIYRNSMLLVSLICACNLRYNVSRVGGLGMADATQRIRCCTVQRREYQLS
jgi:hypothetical protein